MSTPWFAKQWLAQREFAACELPKIRDAELRKLPPSAPVHHGNLIAEHAGSQPGAPKSRLTRGEAMENGLVTQQAWFMRGRMIDLERRLQERAGGAH